MTGSTSTTAAARRREEGLGWLGRPGERSVSALRRLAATAAVVGCLPALLAGCGDGTAGASASDVVRDTVGGRPLVRNPGQPVRDDAARVRSELRWSEPLRLEPGRVRSWHPEPEVRATAEGVVVSVPGAGAMTVRDPGSGSARAAIDASGEGGGRLDSLFAVAATDSFIAAGDADGIELFRFDGEPVGRLPAPGRLTDLYGAGGRGIVAESFGGGGLAWTRYSGPGAEGSTYPPVSVSATTRTDANRPGCWKTSGGGEGMLVSSCAHPIVIEVDHDGRVVREIELGLPPDSSSEEQLRAVREQVAMQVEAAGMEPTAQALDAMQQREARRHPLVKKYRGARRDPVTGEIALLEQVPDYMGWGPATVHLLDREGVYRARLEFDESWYDFDVRDGRLYALRRRPSGEDARIEVVAYDIRRGR